MTKECSCHTKATPADIQAALDYAAIAASLPVDEVDPAYFIPPASLTAATKMSISLDGPLPGQVYGTVAPEGRCILDGGASCWTVADLQRDDPNLDRVHQGDARLTDGTLLKIAALSGDVGHAPAGLSAQQANDWMGATGTQFARVRFSYKEGVGLVAAGIAWPEIVANQRSVAALRASPTSLDARWLSAVAWLKDEGRYALCGAVFVNTPGLPLNRAAALGVYEDEQRFMLSFDGVDLGIIGEHANAITAAATVETPASKPPAVAPVIVAPPSTDPSVLDRLTALEGRVAEQGQLLDALANAELNRQDDAASRLIDEDDQGSLEGLVNY